MKFLKNLVINLAVLIGLGLIIYAIYPGLIKLVIETGLALYGPIIILLTVILAALPRIRRD